MKKIVFTGGPSSGKTKIANWLKEKYPQHTILLPEAATILYRGGFPRYEDKFSKNLQQQAIFKVQKTMEEIERKVHPEEIILCDRGSMDGLAYWTGEEEQFFKTMETDLQKELDSYDACFFMQSPCKADYVRYSIRIEDYNTALEIEKRLHSIWSKHKKFYYIQRQESLLEKSRAVQEIFSTLLNHQ